MGEAQRIRRIRTQLDVVAAGAGGAPPRLAHPSEPAAGGGAGGTAGLIQDLLTGAATPVILAKALWEQHAHGRWAESLDQVGVLLRTLGQLWAEERLSYTSVITLAERVEQALQLCVKPLDGAFQRTALAVMAPDDLHHLGLLLAELVVRDRSYSVIRAPLGSLLHGIERLLDLDTVVCVLVSASAYSQSASRLSQFAADLAEPCRARNIDVYFGGAGAWPELPTYGQRLRTLTGFDRALCQGC